MLKIRDARIKAGLTQKELAEQLGVAVGTLSDYENNKHSPDPDRLNEIADTCSVTVDFLLGREIGVNEISHRLVAVRKRAGYTRKRLSEETGIPYGTISKYETGEREPSNEYISLIARLFDVTTDYILGLESEASDDPIWLKSFNAMRKTSGLSLDILSAKSGVPRGTVSKISAGITRSPALDTMKSLVYAMGYSLDDLYREKETPPDLETQDQEELLKNELFDKLSDKCLALGDLSVSDINLMINIGNILKSWFCKSEEGSGE